MKKYELTEETKTLANGTVLHRIRALRDFSLMDGDLVCAGDLGGWLETENNLSQNGTAWVFQNAMVYENAWVCENAIVGGNAQVYGNAQVCVNARIRENAKIYGKARIYGFALVCNNAQVYENAHVCEIAVVSGDTKIYGHAFVFGKARVYGDAEVCGNADVCGNAIICGNTQIKESHDYAIFKNTWSSGRFFTYTRSNKMWMVGCFYGTGKDLIAKAYKDSKLSGQCYETIVRAQEAIDAAVKEDNAAT